MGSGDVSLSINGIALYQPFHGMEELKMVREIYLFTCLFSCSDCAKMVLILLLLAVVWFVLLHCTVYLVVECLNQ